MGQMRFHVPRRERVSEEAIDRAYMAGMEYIPWRTRTTWAEDQLVVEREEDESGSFYIPWNVQGHGELVLSTTRLMEWPKPYNLPVELARGTLNRLRNQLAVWQPQGFVPTEDCTAKLKEATAKFIKAATSLHDPLGAAEQAEAAIREGLDAIAVLGKDFVSQVFALRHQQSPKLGTLLVGDIGTRPLSPTQTKHFLSAFNSASVSFNWRDVEINEGEHDWTEADKQIEWCRRHGLKICSGPLLHLNQRQFPDWLYLWEDDFDTIRQYALQYVEAAVKRYSNVVHIWHCAAGMNTLGTLSLPEEYKLRLTVDAIETVHKADTRSAPVVISFDQPWAEYLARADLDLSPLHFADALVRADLRVSGLGLEVNLGYWPGGTLSRDLLEFNRLIDQWSQLGLPLLFYLTIPSSDAPDSLARPNAKALANTSPQGLSVKSQLQFASELIPMLVSKQCVHGVVWNQLCDSQPHEFPHGGLFDNQENPKPALTALAKLRQDHLT